MANFLPKRNSLPRKTKHWSNRVKETAVSRASNGAFNVHLEGGAEYGEFIYIGEVLQEKIKVKKGKLHVDDIVLEIDNEPVAGYTQSDVIDFVKKAGEIITFRTVKQDSGITKDIRQFLTTQFDKGSVDNDLQQTIRENLYKRTVPCTTRTPRDGEIPGVDYTFLTLDEFRDLEQSGQLLESGIFEGNHYGTPKPPVEPQKEPKPSTRPQNNSYSSMDRKRPRSYPDNRNHNDNKNYKDVGFEKSNKIPQNRRDQDLGPLPPNWEIGYTEINEKYYIDHNTGSTQWLDPRLARVQKAGADECDDDELPFGWEKIIDSKYGTYYIDHNNKRTQFENPVRQRRKSHNSSRYNGEHSRSYRSSPPSIRSAAAMAKAQEAEASARWPGVDFDEPPEPPAYTSARLEPMPQKFIIDGRKLEGELIRTILPKGSRGFGFTIVGGDQPGELLQIKSIVADSAASKDGILRMGDALVRVNGLSVFSKSHQDVVGMFQAMPIGESVELEMIRGYPLPFDPNDPNVETIGPYTVVKAPASSTHSASPTPSDRSGSSFSNPRGTSQNYNQGGQLSGNPHLYPARHHAAPIESPVGQQQSQYSSSTFPRTSTAIVLPKGTPEFITVRVVKGPMGFGFTIADSPYGQKVKQILDASRCTELREGDILVEINGQLVRSCTHNEAVNILKNCPKDREAVMVIQRGGLTTPLKNSPMTVRKEEGQDGVVQRNPRPKSTPVMRYDGQQSLLEPQPVLKSGSVGNMVTTGESTRNQEIGSGYRQSQPQVEHGSEPYNRYPSLKKAVASNSHNRSSEMQNGARSSTSTDDGAVELTIDLKRGEMGFGFRIVGGQEEKTQVSVGTIVPGGAADKDGRLRKGDEILTIDGINITGASHRRVISLMSNAAQSGHVLLGLRRWRKSGRITPTMPGMRRSTSTSSELMNMSNQPSQMNHVSRLSSRSAGNLVDYGKNERFGHDIDEIESIRSFHSQPGESQLSRANHRDRRRSESDVIEPPGSSYRDVTLYREEREGFGFVILSSVHKSGSTIGRIIQGSPADRCQQLHVGDRLVAVNGTSIVGMHHSDIVDTIKLSGQTVTLRIALCPAALDSEESKKLSRMSAPNIPKQTDNGLGSENRWPDSRSASVDQLQDIDRQNERRKEELLRRHKEELRRQKQELLEKQRAEMRRLEEQQDRYREEYNPPFPSNPTKKPAPPPVKPKPTKDKVHQLQRETQQTEQWNGETQVPTFRPPEPNYQYGKPPQQNRPPPPPRHSIPVGSRDNLGRVGRLNYEGSESRTIERPVRDQTLSKTNQMLLVELRRQANGYGFSIRGGQEMNMPVLVLRIAEGGAADIDGRLKIGDEIVEINGHRTEGIKHSEAIEVIKNGGPRVVLLIKRANADTSFDKGIPNGGQTISNPGWVKPSTGVYRPPPQQQPARDVHVYSR